MRAPARVNDIVTQTARKIFFERRCTLERLSERVRKGAIIERQKWMNLSLNWQSSLLF